VGIVAGIAVKAGSVDAASEPVSWGCAVDAADGADGADAADGAFCGAKASVRLDGGDAEPPACAVATASADGSTAVGEALAEGGVIASASAPVPVTDGSGLGVDAVAEGDRLAPDAVAVAAASAGRPPTAKAAIAAPARLAAIALRDPRTFR
jgi:hypothetical protein